MILELLRIIGALVLILFLPGYFFIQALFPRKNEIDETDDFLYRIILSVALSVILAILLGFLLGSIGIDPDTGKGYFQTPYIFGGLVLISVVMFIIGLYRGAYPVLNPGLKSDTELPISKENRSEFYRVLEQWRELKEKLQRLEERINEEGVSNRKRYQAARERYMKGIDELEQHLKELSGSMKGIKTEAKRLHELINEWKNLKNELHQCEGRMDTCTGKLYERNRRLADKLKLQIDEIERKITFLKSEGK